ncbi:MAG: beta-lactamase family protein [Planctomycetia bacterium]|nr:beta-lactamase family protein [Planctomycetia bacterium]
MHTSPHEDLSRRLFLGRSCCSLAAVGFATRASAAADVEGEHSKQIDKVVHKNLKAGGPGIAVLVVSAGEIEHARGYGFADIETKRPITTRTPFDLASVSKQFTAMAVMILAEREQLTLRDDVRKHLPELPAFDEDRPIRILDLLHHTSGLTDYMELWTGTDAEFEKLPTLGVLKIAAKHKLGHKTGTQYEYSNTNYALLAILVERVAKMTFAKFQAKEIFTPLAMRDSFVYDGSVPHPNVIPRGYKRTDDGVELVGSPNVIVGDGNQFSSIEDMAKWDLALRSHKLVSKQMQQRAYTPGKLDDGEAHDYGFGWTDASSDDHRAVSHDGSWAGTATYICRYLDDDLTVVILSNDDAFDVDALGDKIAEVYS